MAEVLKFSRSIFFHSTSWSFDTPLLSKSTSAVRSSWTSSFRWSCLDSSDSVMLAERGDGH